MKALQHKLLIALIVLTVSSCFQKKVDKQRDIEIIADKLIPIDFNDINYKNLILRDTITPDKWSIKYLVRNDYTRYDNIYIECLKRNRKVIYAGDNLLQFRSGFIPEFIGETKSFLFFSHRCATDCQSLLVLSKGRDLKFQDYDNIVSYNLELSQFLYIPDKTVSNKANEYVLGLLDFQKKQEFKLTFNKVCTAINGASCIEKVIFDKRYITIQALLKDNIQSDSLVAETITFDLKLQHLTRSIK